MFNDSPRYASTGRQFDVFRISAERRCVNALSGSRCSGSWSISFPSITSVSRLPGPDSVPAAPDPADVHIDRPGTPVISGENSYLVWNTENIVFKGLYQFPELTGLYVENHGNPTATSVHRKLHQADGGVCL